MPVPRKHGRLPRVMPPVGDDSQTTYRQRADAKPRSGVAPVVPTGVPADSRSGLNVLDRGDSRPELVLIGSSVRALASSARRAGYRVLAADQFGDEDLRGMALATTVIEDWPQGLMDYFQQLPADPPLAGWLYSGALENHPDLLEELSALRPNLHCLGCSASTLRRVRNPFLLREHLMKAGLACLELGRADDAPRLNGAWIEKPIASGAGLGVRRRHLPDDRIVPGTYLQRLVTGQSLSGLFIADGYGRSSLLGLSLQLNGERAAGAAGFLYCGSLAPLRPSDLSGTADASCVFAQAEQTGAVIAEAFELKGLFGIDFIREEASGTLWTLEVNPRATASMELYERAWNRSLLPLHMEACRGTLSPGTWPSSAVNDGRPVCLDESICHGKVIVYAPGRLIAPDLAHLVRSLRLEREIAELEVADLPRCGIRIEAGHPVCTLLTSGRSADHCRGQLLDGARLVRQTLTERALC